MPHTLNPYTGDVPTLLLFSVYTLEYMSMTTGSLGFTIPIQNLQASQEVTMTPAEVTSWRNHLPMADTGNAAKKVFHAIGD